MKKLLIFISLSILLFFICSVSTEANRSTDIRRLMKATGVGYALGDIARAMMVNLSEVMKLKHNLSDEFIAAFQEEFVVVVKADFWAPGGMADLLSVIYDDFTNGEINQLISFYESPVGRKQAELLQKMGELVQDLTPKLQQRMKDEWIPVIFSNLEKRGFDKEGNRIK